MISNWIKCISQVKSEKRISKPKMLAGWPACTLASLFIFVLRAQDFEFLSNSRWLLQNLDLTQSIITIQYLLNLISCIANKPPALLMTLLLQVGHSFLSLKVNPH